MMTAMAVARASSDAFHAVADPTRRTMLERLLPSGTARTAGELGADLGLTQPTISQHLKVLREAGLVSEERAGRQRLYELQAEPLAQVRDWLSPYEKFWRDKMRSLRALLDEEADS